MSNCCLLELPDDIWLSVLKEWVPQSKSIAHLDTAICSHEFRSRYLQWIQNLLVRMGKTKYASASWAEWIYARQVHSDDMNVSLTNWEVVFEPEVLKARGLKNSRKRDFLADIAKERHQTVDTVRRNVLSRVKTLTLHLERPPQTEDFANYILRRYKRVYAYLLPDEEAGEAPWLTSIDAMLSFISTFCVFSSVETVVVDSSSLTAATINWKLLQQTLSSRVFPAVKKIRLALPNQNCFDILLFGQYFYQPPPYEYQIRETHETQETETVADNVWQLPTTVETLFFERLDLTYKNENEFLVFLNHNVSSAVTHLQVDSSLPGFNPLGHSRSWFVLGEQPLPRITSLTLGHCDSASVAFVFLWRDTLRHLHVTQRIGQVLHKIVRWERRETVLFPALESLTLSQDKEETETDNGVSRLVDYRLLLSLSLCPQLRHIRVCNDTCAFHLFFSPERDTLLHESLRHVPLATQTNEHLRESLELDFQYARKCVPGGLDLWHIRCANYPQLRHLSLKQCPMQWRHFCTLWRSLPLFVKLQTLRIDVNFERQSGHSDASTLETLVSLAPIMTVTQLVLSLRGRGVVPIYSSFIVDLGRVFPNLTTLECSHVSRSVTGTDIDTLVSRCPHLTSLIITGTRILSLPGTQFIPSDVGDTPETQPCTMQPFRRFRRFQLNRVYVPKNRLVTHRAELMTQLRWFLRWIGKSYKVTVSFLFRDADDTAKGLWRDSVQEVLTQEAEHIWKKEVAVKFSDYELGEYVADVIQVK